MNYIIDLGDHIIVNKVVIYKTIRSYVNSLCIKNLSTLKGRIDAKSQVQVKVRIRNMGYKPLTIRELSKEKGWHSASLQSLSLKEKIDFTQTFLTLNKAGLPIIESLIFIEKDAASRQI